MPFEPGFSQSSTLFINFGRHVLRRVGKWRFDLTIGGRDNIPAGPMVATFNHLSHIDPVLGFVALERSVHFLAVDELYGQSRFFDDLIEWLGAVPLSRTRAPLGALQRALRYLDLGGVIGVFPEGRRVWGWGESQPKRGAAWLALFAGVPLVPVAIAGSEDVMGLETNRLTAAPLTIEICEPIEPDEFLAYHDPVGAIIAEWEHRMTAKLAPEKADVQT